VALQPDGGVIVGGAFTGISDPVNAAHSRRRIARLENGAATSELSVPSRSVIQWSRGGSSPEATAVRFDFSLDEGVSWIPLGDGVRTEGGWTLPTNLNGSGQVRGSATIHAGGSEHGGMGLVREVVDFEFFNPPSVTILGSKKIRTTRKKVILRSTAIDPDGDLVSVNFIDSRLRGRKWRPASGTTTLVANAWSATVLLKPGKNVVQVEATDSRSLKSPIQRVTILKK
jgi:hypothetical protein